MYSMKQVNAHASQMMLVQWMITTNGVAQEANTSFILLFLKLIVNCVACNIDTGCCSFVFFLRIIWYVLVVQLILTQSKKNKYKYGNKVNAGLRHMMDKEWTKTWNKYYFSDCTRIESIRMKRWRDKKKRNENDVMVCEEINTKNIDLSERYLFYVRAMALTDKRKRNILETSYLKLWIEAK